MKKSPDFHLQSRRAFLDEKGNEYFPHFCEERDCGKNRIQYAIEFLDQDAELPVDTALYLGTELWRQPAPQCAVSETQYTSVTKSVIKNTLSCVSGDNCYENNFIDDTARNIKFFFADGSMFEYSGIFYNKSTNTHEIIRNFINKYAQTLNSVYD